MEGLDVVINVSRHGESARNAIENLSRMPSAAVGLRVHLVSTQKNVIKGHEEFPMTWHNSGTLDATKLDGLAAIHMSADMCINELALIPVTAQFNKYYEDYDEFALRAAISIPSFNIATGFVLLIAMMDWIRTSLHWRKYHVPATDLMIKTYVMAYPTRKRVRMRLQNSPHTEFNHKLTPHRIDSSSSFVCFSCLLLFVTHAFFLFVFHAFFCLLFMPSFVFRNLRGEGTSYLNSSLVSGTMHHYSNLQHQNSLSLNPTTWQTLCGASLQHIPT